MSYIQTLRTVRTSAHAVVAAMFNRAHLDNMINAGLLVKGTRSCLGKVFTKESARNLIDFIITSPQRGHVLATLAAIKAAPHAVMASEVGRTTDVNASIVASNFNLLFRAGLIKEHSRKHSHYFTNPTHANLVAGLVIEYTEALAASRAPRAQATPVAAPIVAPVINDRAVNGHVISAMDKLVLAAIKNAPASVTVNDIYNKLPRANQDLASVGVSVGFLIGLGLVRVHRKRPTYFFTEPTKASAIASLIAPPAPVAPVVPEGAVMPTDAVLALCRLSEHGVSMNGVWAAFQKLITEGIIRADKRDGNKNSKEVRYFVRKGGQRMGDIRAKADARIAKLIAKNENLVDLINGEVDSL